MMLPPEVNPFNITKAVDFSDEQILRTFVNLPDPGFRGLAQPTSPMPMFLLGGKGSGRTHLMRYFSYPVQRLRMEPDLVSGLQREGYIGIYLRCTGLNANRFSQKGQADEKWEAVFSYYMDLWLAQLTLRTIEDALKGDDAFREAEPAICAAILESMEQGVEDRANSIHEMAAILHRLQREIDVKVNNAAVSRELEVTIRVSRGKLPFRIPQILVEHVPSLADVQILYLIDEFENLTELQQKYVNTLVREREAPASFKIGARLYGVRTMHTYAAEEENREGSEYESIYLDRHFQDNKKSYTEFARRLIARRLMESQGAISDSRVLTSDLDRFFDELSRDQFLQSELTFVSAQPPPQRPHFQRLAEKLGGTGKSASDIDEIVSRLSFPDVPLLEKVNVFLLYQDWSNNRPLVPAAKDIGEQARMFRAGGAEARRHANAMEKFKFDLFAQLLRENHRPQLYLGLGTFVAMSTGLPRNLLIILKRVHRWATFFSEQPFSSQPISREAQSRGVLEAATWFYDDAQVPGSLGQAVYDAIGRLGDLFRRLRFSDKPVECSLVTFSADLSQASEVAREVIKLAEQWSLLIRIRGGQRDRNRQGIDAKFQLNGMLCPRWDLPIFRRGAIALTVREVNAIFDPSADVQFDEILRVRLLRMNAPFGAAPHGQDQFPGFDQ